MWSEPVMTLGRTVTLLHIEVNVRLPQCIEQAGCLDVF